MPTTNVYPRANGTDTGGTQVGGSSKFNAISTNDGDTSYVSFASNTSYTAFLDSISAATIDSNPTYTWVGEWVGTTTFNWLLRLRRGSNLTDSGQAFTAAYATYTRNPANPPGGGAWTPAAFNETEIGGTMNTWSSGESRITQAYGTVTYTPPAGGFAFLIGSWLGPLVAVGLHEMPALLDHIVMLGRSRAPRSMAQSFVEAKHRGVNRPIISKFEPDEVRLAWEDMRAYRHPRFFHTGDAAWI